MREMPLMQRYRDASIKVIDLCDDIPTRFVAAIDTKLFKPLRDPTGSYIRTRERSASRVFEGQNCTRERG